jgi:hypothetical protein
MLRRCQSHPWLLQQHVVFILYVCICTYVFLTAEHVLRLSIGAYSVLLEGPSCSSSSSTSTRIDRFTLPYPTLPHFNPVPPLFPFFLLPLLLPYLLTPTTHCVQAMLLYCVSAVSLLCLCFGGFSSCWCRCSCSLFIYFLKQLNILILGSMQLSVK